MSSVFSAAVPSLFLLLGTALFASETPQASERLSIPMPKDFKLGFEQKIKSPTFEEWVPQNETVEHWTRIITVSRFAGVKDGINRGYVTAYADNFEKACPGTTRQASIPAMGLPGGRQIPILNGTANGYRKSVVGLHCPHNGLTGTVEDQIMVAMQGDDTLYFIHYAFARDPSPTDEADRMAFLRSIKLCDTNAPSHPC